MAHTLYKQLLPLRVRPHLFEVYLESGLFIRVASSVVSFGAEAQCVSLGPVKRRALTLLGLKADFKLTRGGCKSRGLLASASHSNSITLSMYDVEAAAG